MKINILLVGKPGSTLDALRRLVQDPELAVIGDTPGGAAALDQIENTSPDLVVMALGAGNPDVLSLAGRVLLYRPRSFVVLLAERMDAETLKQAVRVGAHNVAEFPASPKAFAEYVKSVYRTETIRLQSLTEKENISWMSRVVTVFGSKGGLGKTTIAVNLAVKLAESRRKVALLDLDLQFGDIPIFMDIEPADTIAELVRDVHTLNIDSVRSYMVVHPSGVHVLCAPKSPEYAETIPAGKVQSLLSLLRSYYDFVIVDTPSSFSDVTLTALESSSAILFVAGLDLSILKNAKLSLSILDSLRQKDKVKILVNRAVEISAVTLEDVQRIVGLPVWARLPSDYNTAVSALNSGVPFVTGAPGTRLSRSVAELAQLLLAGGDGFGLRDAPPRRKRLFRLR